MNFIIIGDKYSKGMKSKGCAGLIKLDKNVSIFDYQYKIIKTCFPKSTITYIGGFEYKKLENCIDKKYPDVNLILNDNYEIKNDSYSLSLIHDHIIDDTFITFGYTILNKKIFDKFDKTSGSQIFVIKNHATPVGCIINDSRIENISFDLPNHIEDLYYISNENIRAFYDLVSDKRHNNYFVFELLNKMIDNNTISIKPSFHSINKVKNYEYTK